MVPWCQEANECPMPPPYACMQGQKIRNIKLIKREKNNKITKKERKINNMKYNDFFYFVFKVTNLFNLLSFC